ncbi:hypothetical protein DVA67_021265 [Solirubrobacter sp. CPCC 204708]|uniref:SGNH hydrolase domain-containing protein n=1 Tax=Solirubrobacter deserti TaxID=2282478 RepID=A0ABT4REM5_9ACTN|nr:SGNH hydrolase domain-containing protein [Solirubrobacter deserti]MBE2318524.1 hypothetical protein [Solirubrobacter deserti]MDA0136982.1 SGNH hydrolase domain-containing protein [Solirubrobacter deserti]
MKVWVVALAALAVLAAFTPPAGAAPSCFGAAARDPMLPCVNPSLRLKVTPHPRNAPLVRGAPCTKLVPEGLVVPCEFGVLSPNARAHFALFGDSHAAHWRPTLAELARGLQWHGYQLSRNSCSLTTVPLAQPEPFFSECAAWKQQVVEWLDRHPEVTTVFLATKTPGPRDYAPGPMPAFEAQVAGHVRAWSWLPASVTRVFVIRDNPSAQVSTMRCVQRALNRRRTPGTHCAIPRATALPPDPVEVAITQADPSRFRLVDLTPHFCDERNCYPVVGGVLVHKDLNHLTRHFAETLGPFLLRAVVGFA